MELSVLLVGWGWTYDELHAGWIEIEELGFDACYVGDDLFPHPDVDTFASEPWTILPAMAATTSRMRIGSLVSPVGRRHPGLFAKMTATTDLISGGRLIVGMGAGNAPEQQASLGQPFPGPVERTQMLREELAILVSMWTSPRTDFDGSYFQLNQAICEPKPVRTPRPEILVALRSKAHLPPVAAEFADRVNLLGGNDDGVRRVIDVIADQCPRYGRTIDDILLGRCMVVLFTDDLGAAAGDRERAIDRRAAEIGCDASWLRGEHAYLASYVGPAEGCADEVRARIAGVGGSESVICIDTIGTNSYERTMAGLRTFAATAMGELRCG